jgi:glutamyl-tRNA reductase
MSGYAMPLRQLLVAGLNHRTAPLAVRERFAYDANQVPNALAELRALGAEHAVLVSTCNRTEVYCWAPEPCRVERFFVRDGDIDNGRLPDYVYVRRGHGAAEHLFRVVAGLDSQVLGESEILGQVKKAWAAARGEGATGAHLDAAFQHAVIAGKRVRTETDLGKQVVSIGSLALRQAAELKPDFADAVVLVLGTGEMATRIVKELKEYPHRSLLIVSHTLQYAEALAAEGGGTPLAIGQMGEALAEADVVFTVTAAPHPIVEKQALAPLDERRSDRPLYIFDLGVPRNTEAEVRDLPFVRLCDLDDLKALSESHRQSRELAVPAAERIIAEELGCFLDWCARRGVAPLISQLRGRADLIRKHQLDWARPRLQGLSTEHEAAVDELTRRLVKHLMHFPISELRSAAGEEDAVAVVARMLGLDRDEPPVHSVDEGDSH